MDKQIDRLIEHIRELEARLGEVDNNLRYQAIYLSYFYTGCGFSFYERLCNSILDYKYGNRPF